MSSHSTDFQGSVIDALREAIERQIPDARAEVSGGGHFNIEVTSPVFVGKNMLESQRLVYGAIADLMKGDKAPLLVEFVSRINLYREPEPFGSHDREPASHPCLQKPYVQRSGGNSTLAQRALYACDEKGHEQ